MGGFHQLSELKGESCLEGVIKLDVVCRDIGESTGERVNCHTTGGLKGEVCVLGGPGALG